MSYFEYNSITSDDKKTSELMQLIPKDEFLLNDVNNTTSPISSSVEETILFLMQNFYINGIKANYEFSSGNGIITIDNANEEKLYRISLPASILPSGKPVAKVTITNLELTYLDDFHSKMTLSYNLYKNTSFFGNDKIVLDYIIEELAKRRMNAYKTKSNYALFLGRDIDYQTNRLSKIHDNKSLDTTNKEKTISATLMIYNTNIYEGEWKDGKKNGQGKCTYVDGEIYDGEWKDDKKHGHGKFIWSSGNIYEGKWKFDKRHGQGKYKWTSGNIYEGEWIDGNIGGHGKYTWITGETYEGSWKEDKKHGKGKEIWPDGNIYEGEWKNGKRNGQGICTFPNGDIYEGEWKDDERHGQGKCLYSDGKVYIGTWKNNMKNGKGICTWPDGTVYDGTWKDNKLHGVGTLKYY